MTSTATTTATDSRRAEYEETVWISLDRRPTNPSEAEAAFRVVDRIVDHLVKANGDVREAYETASKGNLDEDEQAAWECLLDRVVDKPRAMNETTEIEEQIRESLDRLSPVIAKVDTGIVDGIVDHIANIVMEQDGDMMEAYEAAREDGIDETEQAIWDDLLNHLDICSSSSLYDLIDMTEDEADNYDMDAIEELATYTHMGWRYMKPLSPDDFWLIVQANYQAA